MPPIPGLTFSSTPVSGVPGGNVSFAPVIIGSPADAAVSGASARLSLSSPFVLLALAGVAFYLLTRH